MKTYSSPFYEHTYTDGDVMYVEDQRKHAVYVPTNSPTVRKKVCC